MGSDAYSGGGGSSGGVGGPVLDRGRLRLLTRTLRLVLDGGVISNGLAGLDDLLAGGLNHLLSLFDSLALGGHLVHNLLGDYHLGFALLVLLSGVDALASVAMTGVAACVGAPTTVVRVHI